jgi:hypothetical protein
MIRNFGFQISKNFLNDYVSMVKFLEFAFVNKIMNIFVLNSGAFTE